jgi:hypothetical protein
MAFKKTVNGEYDPRINLGGRPKTDGKPLTNRQIRERDFLSFLRKIKPHVAVAIATACKIMQKEDATDANKLKAATIILAEYKQSLEATYNQDYDNEEGEEVNPVNKPKFSLTMIKNGEIVK